MKSLSDGADIPIHCNRELSIFVYLSDVEKDAGGETAFFKDDHKISRVKVAAKDSSGEVLRITPEMGMAVVFYATLQPVSRDPKDLPEKVEGVMDEFALGDGRFVRIADDMCHAGLPVLKGTKDIMSCWCWPSYVNRAEQDGRGQYKAFSYQDVDKDTDGKAM